MKHEIELFGKKYIWVRNEKGNWSLLRWVEPDAVLNTRGYWSESGADPLGDVQRAERQR